MKMDKKNVLVIPDLHIPAVREGFLEHCVRIRDMYGCGTIISVGDICDFHGFSYHEREPGYMGCGEELTEAQQILKMWAKEFPVMTIVRGNHDALLTRRAKTIGFPDNILKNMNEILKTPKTWNWVDEYIFDGVLYIHGIGHSGVNAHLNAMKERRQNVVMGHSHSTCGVAYSATKKDLLFGACAGCGVDDSALSFRYGQHFAKRSVIACMVVLYGKPIIEVMSL